jgi:Mg-chelatase subunit ChlD
MTEEKKNLPAVRVGGAKVIGAAAKFNNALANKTEAPLVEVKTLPNRIGIVFDDSGSMGGRAIEDAKDAIDEFLQSCNRNDTAIALFPMNAHPIQLSVDYMAIALMKETIDATGGTPLFEVLDKMVRKEGLTRAIVFSDGSPSGVGGFWDAEERQAGWHLLEKPLYVFCKEKNLKVDSVFIGEENETTAIRIMKRIAEETGGVFLHFVPGKSNFAGAFKYLAPSYRAMLENKSFVEKLETGKV